MASESEGKAAPLMSEIPVALMADSRSAFMEVKDWLWATWRRMVVLWCLKRRVSWLPMGDFEGLM